MRLVREKVRQDTKGCGKGCSDAAEKGSCGDMSAYSSQGSMYAIGTGLPS